MTCCCMIAVTEATRRIFLRYVHVYLNVTRPPNLRQEICQHAERRWASKLVRGQETGELPSLKVGGPGE